MGKLVEELILHTKKSDAYVLTEETDLWHKLNAVANIDKDSFKVLDNDTLVLLDRELNTLGLKTEYRKFTDPITVTSEELKNPYHYIYIAKQK